MKLYVVDDSVPLRERLVSTAAEIGNIEIVGQSGEANEAIEQILRLRPHVVILDIRVIGGSGIYLLETIKREAPATIAIMFTNFCIAQYRDRCEKIGANYFFAKSTDFEKLVEVLTGLARHDKLKPTGNSQTFPHTR